MLREIGLMRIFFGKWLPILISQTYLESCVSKIDLQSDLCTLLKNLDNPLPRLSWSLIAPVTYEMGCREGKTDSINNFNGLFGLVSPAEWTDRKD